MEYLPGGYTLCLTEGCFPFSTDSAVLAYFAHLPKHARILDLGSGGGTLGLLLCARDGGCRVTGMELDELAHLCAMENIRRNAVDSRMESICADLRTVPSLFSPGSFDCVISNPPYFSGGPASRTHSAARREDFCTAADLMKSAGWALKYGGDFYLVHRPERLAELIALASQNGMEAKRLGLMRHKEDGPVTLILLQLRKGGKPGLVFEEFFLYNADNTPSDTHRKIYHLQED